jgi:hypothetical protein
MGTPIHLIEAEFFIPQEKRLDALKALRELGRREPRLMWGVSDAFVHARSLPEALDNAGWYVECDEDYNIVGITCENEKAGSEDEFFEALAPFVKDGSYLEVRYYDSPFRWVFKNGKLETLEPEVTWE